MYKRKVTKEIKKYSKRLATKASMDTILNFGKYKYLEIRQVINRNPQYIFWCLEEELIIPTDYEMVRILIDNELLKDYDFKLNKIIK